MLPVRFAEVMMRRCGDEIAEDELELLINNTLLELVHGAHVQRAGFSTSRSYIQDAQFKFIHSGFSRIPLLCWDQFIHLLLFLLFIFRIYFFILFFYAIYIYI